MNSLSTTLILSILLIVLLLTPQTSAQFGVNPKVKKQGGTPPRKKLSPFEQAQKEAAKSQNKRNAGIASKSSGGGVGGGGLESLKDLDLSSMGMGDVDIDSLIANMSEEEVKAMEELMAMMQGGAGMEGLAGLGGGGGLGDVGDMNKVMADLAEEMKNMDGDELMLQMQEVMNSDEIKEMMSDPKVSVGILLLFLSSTILFH